MAAVTVAEARAVAATEAVRAVAREAEARVAVWAAVMGAAALAVVAEAARSRRQEKEWRRALEPRIGRPRPRSPPCWRRVL